MTALLVLGISIAMLLAFVVAMSWLLHDLRRRDRLRVTPPDLDATPADQSITWELSAEGLWRSELQQQFHTRHGRITLALAIVAFLGILTTFALLLSWMHPGTSLLLAFVPSVALLITVVAVVLLVGRTFVVGKQPDLLCRHTLELRAAGLRHRTATHDRLWQWSEIKELAETREFVLLRTASMGLIGIPKSAFASDDELRRFLSAARGAAAPTPA